VISERLAARLWPAGNAIGQRIRQVVPTPTGPKEGPWRAVVGVSANVRQAYDDPDQSDFYTPKTPDGRFGSFYVRSQQPGPRLFEQLQRAAAEIDRDAIVSLTRSAGEDDLTMAGSRFITGLLSAFAAIAAFLAMLGLYGVTAYAVQQRRKEMAIRAALGASGRTIFGIFLRDGAWLLGVGTIVGVIGGILSARVLRSQLIGVETFDVATLAVACGLLLAAGFSAIAWAARGAARTNPAGALNAN
jgi:putative ABC transport system permease protein